MAHGNADRLAPPDQIDLDAIDRTLNDGADNPDGERLGILNDLLGPKHFGKIFPNLAPFRPADSGLIALGTAMQEGQPNQLNPPPDSNIPAGFTYFGQFIDHDLTLDPTVGFPFINDPDVLKDARTPAFDLDSLYGLGPDRQPELYQVDGKHLLLGSTAPEPVPAGTDPNLPRIPGSLPNDLLRNADRTPVIGDSRNDENLVIAQTHVAFVKFHNKVLDSGNAGGFGEARRLVTWHYQWIVLHDHLRRIVDTTVLDDVLQNGRKFFKFDKTPFMPVEFSVAAYRLGHSMVRETYNYNRVFNHIPQLPHLADGTLSLLFTFTGKGGLAGNSGIPSNWIIDWRRFHEVTSDGPQSPFLNKTRPIDTKIVATLFNLPIPGVVPSSPGQLPVRNLLRGSRLGLPMAQDVATAIGVAPISPTDLANGSDGAIVKQFGFDTQTPLWYYILKEAELLGGSNHLGPVGSRIVSEVFVGLLQGDRNSFLSRQPDFKPTLPSRTAGDFTFADLLLFVDDINPIGPGNPDV